MLIPALRRRVVLRGLASALVVGALAAAPACRRSQPAPQGSAAPAERAFQVLFYYEGDKTLSGREGEAVEVPLRIKNAGRAAWSSLDTPPVFLSYHLLDGKGRTLRWDNPRIPLPRPVKPGETLSLLARVKSPLEQGRYRLEFDMVREGAAWFSSEGSKTLPVDLGVTPRAWPEDRYRLDLGAGPYTRLEPARTELTDLLKLIRLTLSHDETSFRGETGKVSGFRAGAAYPQIWLRDAATVVPAARFYYDDDHLSSWLVELLARQAGDGSLQDWLDPSGKCGKNTTASDQEASAVQAAAQVCRLKGTRWLRDKVREVAVIDRLESALEFVLAERFDERTGLVRSAHTLDWGDVDHEDSDERAVTADDRTPWVAGIYNQSQFYGAARDLAGMLASLGRGERSLFWRVKAETLQANTNRWLWQKAKGFYRVHIHLRPGLRHDFDEDEIFAVGGNVAAVLTGLADEAQGRAILAQALARQKAMGASTVSGVLLPPYPRGTFKHPLVDDTYEYQNGGQWDWFGGRLILALYRHGFSREATAALLAIAAKDIGNGGLCEWDDRQGTGRGSDDFAGSAGSLGRALFEGYFGIDAGRDALTLEPRLGNDAGRVHAYLPSADLTVAYDYRPRPDGRSLELTFASDFGGRGVVRILLPWSSPGGGSSSLTEGDCEMTLDGRPVPFRLARMNEDDYAVLETDFRRHRLELRLSQHGQARAGAK